jgi:iron complex outermembrane receptor protein
MTVNRFVRHALLAVVSMQPLIAAAQQAELEEVIVTAERRAANLQTTPIAVSALGADDLERLQIGSIGDLDTSVPAMTVENNVASNAAVTVSLRGNAEQNAAFLFSEPGVGLYMNGVYRRLSGSNIELADIERIEVLRGPQGTLFGRNTLAGAINIVTRAPGETLDGSLQLGYGAFDSSRLRAAVSGPIGGNWKGSASVLRQQRGEGWATNRVDGRKVGENEFLGGMGSLAYEGEAFDALFTVYASNSESDGAWSAPVSVTTRSLVFPDRSDVAGASIRVGGTTVDPFNDTDQHGADLVLTFPLGDFTLKSITAYSKLQDDWAVDFTAAQLAAPAPMGPFDAVPGTSGFFRIALAEQDQVSQEFNLTRTGERLDTILGAFYYKETSDQAIRDYFAGGFFAGVPADHRLVSESIAAYAQANYRLDDRWTLVAGGRYNNDDKTFSGRKANAAGAPANFSKDRSFSRFTGKLGVEFRLSEDLFTYATLSQGYKAGTYDPFAPADTIANGIDPETVDSLEFGVKAELLDRSLRLNSALFLVRYKDLAIGTITPAGLELQNAGESEIKGLESELTWIATDRFRVYGSLALMDSKWKSLAPSALLTGVRLSDAPPFTYDFQGTVSAVYEVPLGTGSLSLTGTARHIDEYYQQVAHLNNPLDRVVARDFVDASLAWQSGDGQHRVVLAGRNLTEEQGQFSALNFSTFLFNNTAAWLPGEPRSWELTYTYSLE